MIDNAYGRCPLILSHLSYRDQDRLFETRGDILDQDGYAYQNPESGILIRSSNRYAKYRDKCDNRKCSKLICM